MLAESVQGLNIQPEGRYVDVTFGGGGHSGEILSQLSSGHLYAFDQDADARANGYADPKFTLIPSNFRFLRDRLEELKATPVDGLLADLGVSSHQFDEASRGFSIRFDADLDMRMDQEAELSAKEVLNTYPEEELARVFKYYGELPQAKRMARAIVAARAEQPIHTVAQLKQLLAPFTPKAKENTFYAVVFQALRIEVNDELSALKEMLEQSAQVIRQGGRLVVISYHSLEDRLVKNYINTGNFEGELQKDFFGHPVGLLFKPLQRKPMEASEQEVLENPRSRSAKMRIAERL
ncbi:MAG: 16S rRNA (cytosine(1402)-N(4))-methyltransferase RsmH [Bacteroidia bacterium]